MNKVIERAGEVLRRPQVVGRALLAGALLILPGCSSTPASGRELKCPTNATEVSRLVGGDPRNWEAINGTDNQAWSFKSEKPQVLNRAPIGRVDTVELGHILHGLKSTSEAFYRCVPKYEIGQESNPEFPQAPTETSK